MRIVRSSKQIAKPLRIRLLSGAASIVLIGCSSLPVVPSVAVADGHIDTRSQLMFNIMIGELAGRRGQLNVATEAYMSAAEISDDQRVAERATQLAVWGRRWEDAEMVGNRWLSLAPQNAEAHELLAQIYLQTGQVNRASKALSGFIMHSTDRKTAVDEVVLTLMREADRARSLEIMANLANQHSGEVEIIVAQARMALSVGGRDDALEHAQSALALDPDNGSALLIKAQALGAMGKPEEGIADIRKALDNDEPNIELRLGFAQLLVDAGRHDDASEQLEILYQQAATTNPDLLLNMGLLALDSKRSDAAIRYLEALLGTGEHSDQAHFYLGRIRDQQQEYSTAIDHYSQVRDESLYIPAQLRSAELHSLIGELDAGRQRIQSLKNVITNQAVLPQIITTEARMLQDAGEGAEAIKILSEGLASFPDSGELLYSRALTADANNDTEMLRNDLSRLIEVEPDNAHAMNALGYHLADNDLELERAIELVERAHQLIPNDAAIIDSMGWVRYKAGDNAVALAYLKQAYELLRDPEIAAHLGEVMWVSGAQDAARDLWNKALLESPDHPKLKQAMERFIQ
ncbi:MAG: tetratricopeptide repeat protein [Granulosicoccaceae bacterium]